MNNNLHTCGRFCRNKLMNLLVIVPLLIAALFAYEAGNVFELSAGTSRIHTSSTKSSYTAIEKKNSNTNYFSPINVDVNAYLHALIYRYPRFASLKIALRTSVPQRLRSLFMLPLKFTSIYVG